MNIPPFAPGCYGSALAFSETNVICRACLFRDRCGPAHDVNLAALRLALGITNVKVKPRKATDTAVPGFTVPKKVQELLDKLDGAKLHITESLAAGINPFVDTLPFMRIACHLLMALYPRNIALARPLLAAGLVSKLGWSQGTADAHARMAMQALVHIGAVDVVDGAIKLRKVA